MKSARAFASASSTKSRMAELLTGLTKHDGVWPSPLPGIKLMRASSYVAPCPVKYEPSIVIVAQGRKNGRLGDRSFTYDANHYLVLTMPMPFECETFGSAEEPMLGISIGVTPALVTELLMQLESAPLDGRPQAIEAAQLDSALSDATVRLLESLRDPEDARILGPQCVREVIYRTLRGPLGDNLRALAAPHSHFGQIGRVLNRFHSEFAKTHDMEALAQEVGMSVSTFHTHFKSITASSPLQYLKTIRLHKARMLMVHDGLNAANAAQNVGYESASQFSREFKRHFGDAPASEASRLRRQMIRLE